MNRKKNNNKNKSKKSNNKNIKNYNKTSFKPNNTNTNNKFFPILLQSLPTSQQKNPSINIKKNYLFSPLVKLNLN